MRGWMVGNCITALALVFWLAFCSPAKAADAPRLGVIDVQQIILESKAGKKARDKVEVERNLKQKEITAKEEEASKLQLEFEKQSSLLSEATRKDKQEALDKKVRDLKRLYDDFTRELQKKEGEYVREIFKEVSEVVRVYGKEKGYTLILERSQINLLYWADEIDLTKQILSLYDSKTK
jgi:outer membrane protein